MKRKVIMGFVWVILLTLATPLFAAGGGGDHGFDTAKFIAKVVNFLLFFGVLFFLVRKPIANFFSQRVQTIQDNLKLAEKSREEAKRQLDDIQAKMAELDHEISEIETVAKKEAERERERLKAEAEKEAERIVAHARVEVESMKRDAIQSLKAYAAEMALDEAETMIRKAVTESDHQRLFAEFSQKLEART